MGIFVGLINADRTEGRGPLVPHIIGEDLPTIIETINKSKGYTGASIEYVNEYGNVQIWGTRADEILPSREERFLTFNEKPLYNPYNSLTTKEIKELQELAKENPEAYEKCLEPYYVFNQYKDEKIEFTDKIFLVVESYFDKIGSYDHYLHQIRQVFYDEKKAITFSEESEPAFITKTRAQINPASPKYSNNFNDFPQGHNVIEITFSESLTTVQGKNVLKVLNDFDCDVFEEETYTVKLLTNKKNDKGDIPNKSDSNTTKRIKELIEKL